MKPHPALLVALVAVAVYSGTLRHSFVYTDVSGILNNPLVRNLDTARILREPWRALTQLSFAVTHYFFGFSAAAFHVTNVLIHACNAMLVFAIAARLARRWLPARDPGMFALAAGLIHAVHPLYTEAVAYVWGRSSSLCALFYFGTLLLVILATEAAGGARLLYTAGAVLAAVSAWETKEEAITLPLVVAGLLAISGSRRAAAAVALAPLLVAALGWRKIMSLCSYVAANAPPVSAGAEPLLVPSEYFLTHIKASVFYYLRLFVLPFGLNAVPDVEPVKRITDPLFLIAAAVLALLAAWSLKAISGDRVIAFALLALLVSPLTAYAVMPLADVAAEHRVYIAGLGFDLAAAWLLARSARHAWAALVGISLVLSFLTLERNRVWASDLTLWQDAARKSPRLARTHLNLAAAYHSAGNVDAAIPEYLRALTINPRLSPAYVDLGVVFLLKGDLGRAEPLLRKAAELSPALPEPYLNLAVAAIRRGRGQDALDLVSKAESLGGAGRVHLIKGDALRLLERYTDARREYELALALLPADPVAQEQARARLKALTVR